MSKMSKVKLTALLTRGFYGKGWCIELEGEKETVVIQV